MFKKAVMLTMILVLILSISMYAKEGGNSGNSGNSRGNNASKSDKVVVNDSTNTNAKESGERADNTNKQGSEREEKRNSKASREERKAEILSQYSDEEIEALSDSEEKIRREHKEFKVLPIDSISSKSAKFKFDTPPVIKDGRTLIPVRAITEGFGATLEYNSETKEVTIIKDDIVIILTLGSNIAKVNGEEVELDVSSSSINNRTYVPLRFIMDVYKLETNWDEDSETIEIVDPEDPVEEPTESPAPTEEPVATPAPTEEPAATPAPTEEPVATPAPTE